MSTFYPRKQTVVTAAVCIIAVISVAHYAHRSSSAPSEQRAVADNSPITVEPSATSGALTATSTDPVTGTDWRKQFTSASDAGTFKAAPGKAVSAKGDVPLTMTDQLGMDLFTRYMDLKQANLLDNSDVVDQTASDLVTKSVASAQPKAYSEKDLRIIPDHDPKALSAFAYSVEQAVELYDATESESSIMGDYTDKNDPSVLARLDPIIATYRRIVSSLLSIPTPQIESADEVSLVNAYSYLEFAAEALRATDTDTVRGIAGVSAHVTGVDELTSSLLAMQSGLQEQGVSFVLNNETAFNVLLN